MMVLHTHIILSTLLLNFKSITVQASSSNNQPTGETITKEVNRASPPHPPSPYRGRLYDPKDEDPKDFAGDSLSITARQPLLKNVNQAEVPREILEPSPTPNIVDLVTPDKFGKGIPSQFNKVQNQVPNNWNNNGHLNEVSESTASNANKLNEIKVGAVVSRPPSPELAIANNISQSSSPTVINPSVSSSPTESRRSRKNLPLSNRLYRSFSDDEDEAAKAGEFVKNCIVEGSQIRGRLEKRLKIIDDEVESLENEKLDVRNQLKKLNGLIL